MRRIHVQSLTSAWSQLDMRRKVIVIAATLAMFAAVLLIARSASRPELGLLFGGLDPAAAGEVITALDARGVIYEVRGNAIYVDAAARDALRMSLAGEGLPMAGARGYELLDELSGFGTTSQMFDAAYWRAREGELARTIAASPEIRTARVHIATPDSRPFSRSIEPSAAVTVATVGGALSASQVKALQTLVAAAVSGLKPDGVAVIDESGGLLSDSQDGLAALRGDDRAGMLRERAERLLAARVGQGNAVVEVSLETITESESIVERRIDPDSRIAISTDVTETESSGQNSEGGDVTVASNLPDGDAGAGAGTSSNQSAESRALTNYEISETERQVVRVPGDVKRLTVAVLVNEVQTIAADGTVTSAPRTAEELADLEELVASAVGLNPERGDVLTLRSLPFEARETLGTAAPAGLLASQPLNIMQLIQIAVAALVALILGLFVVRPVLAGRAAAAEMLPPPEGRGADFDPTTGAQFAPMEPGAGLMLEPPVEKDDPVERLRDMIAQRETETVQILQDWIEDGSRKERA